MIKPILDRLVVRLEKGEKKTESGLFLPETKSSSEGSSVGEVVAIGPGRPLNNGTIITQDIKVGDVVLFLDQAGTKVKVDGQELMVISEQHVLAVM